MRLFVLGLVDDGGGSRPVAIGKLGELLEERCDMLVDWSSLFDVMVKRLHEYKRQVLNVMHILHRYCRLKADPDLDLLIIDALAKLQVPEAIEKLNGADLKGRNVTVNEARPRESRGGGRGGPRGGGGGGRRW